MNLKTALYPLAAIALIALMACSTTPDSPGAMSVAPNLHYS